MKDEDIIYLFWDGTEKDDMIFTTKEIKHIDALLKKLNKRIAKVYVLCYDDCYGYGCTERIIIHGIYSTEEKAEQQRDKNLKQFYKEYPNHKDCTPYYIGEWEVDEE